MIALDSEVAHRTLAPGTDDKPTDRTDDYTIEPGSDGITTDASMSAQGTDGSAAGRAPTRKSAMKIAETSNAGNVCYTECDSPIGTLQIASDGNAIIALLMYEHRHAPDRANWRKVSPHEVPVLGEAVRQLGEYFDGTRLVFELPLAAQGTDMQKDVWFALSEIPFGETRSYGAIAERIGRPTASRAVGAANGKNPISIIVPCHRVIGSNGSMTGFGGGIERKVWLLAHERKINPHATEVGANTARLDVQPTLFSH